MYVLNMYIYICIYVYMYIYIHIYTYIYIYVHMHTHEYTHIYVNICIYTYLYMYIFTSLSLIEVKKPERGWRRGTVACTALPPLPPRSDSGAGKMEALGRICPSLLILREAFIDFFLGVSMNGGCSKHTPNLMRTCVRTHAHTRSHPHKHAHVITKMHTHKHKHAQTHTHTHTYIVSEYGMEVISRLSEILWFF